MKASRHERTAACYRFEAELQDYLEGENRPFEPAHARECEFCRVVLEDLETLRSTARALPLEEPSAVVWANVRAQLAAEGAFAEPSGAWNWIWQLDFLRRPIPVAAFACLVALGCLFTAPQNNPRQEPASAPAYAAGGATVRTMALIGDSGALEQVVRELEKNFRAREGSLAPDVKATYENSLISLDASIRECSDSLQREPGNSLAHDYLLAAYAQKAEVLSSALESDEGR